MEETQETIADALKASFEEFDAEDATETPPAEAEPEISEPEPEAEPVAQHATEEAEEDTPEAEPEKVFQAPEHWSSDEKEQFNALSPEAQEVLLERDKSFQRGYQERVQGISDIEKALEPWKQVLAQRGVSEADAIRTLFAAQSQIEQDPVQGILALAQRFGVADQLKSQFVPETDDDFADPEIKALRSELASLKSSLNQVQVEGQEAQTRSLQEQVDSFASATNDKGEKLHPHFDQVRTLMAPLVQSGKSMEEAYSEVVWSVPEYREALMRAKETPKEQTELEKARKVKEAKKAAKSVKSPKGSPNEADDVELTVKQELEAAWKELTG